MSCCLPYFPDLSPADCSLCVFADFYLNSLSQLPAEMQEQLLSCLSNEPYSNWEPWDKKVAHNFSSVILVTCLCLIVNIQWRLIGTNKYSKPAQ